MHRKLFSAATISALAGAAPIAAKAALETEPYLEFQVARKGSPTQYFLDPNEAAALLVSLECAENGYTSCKVTRVGAFNSLYTVVYDYVNQSGANRSATIWDYRYLTCDAPPALYLESLSGTVQGPYPNRFWSPPPPARRAYCKSASQPDPDAGRQSELGAGDCLTRPTVGNPISPALGSKYQQIVDIEPVPGSPLSWVRYYNSGIVPSDATSAAAIVTPTDGRLGSRWRGIYDRSIEVVGDSTHVRVLRHTGEKLDFTKVGDSYRSSVDPRGRLERVGETWVYHSRSGDVEQFDKDGRLTDINPGTANHIRLRYDQALLEASDLQGRRLTLAYDEAGRVSSISSNGETAVSYTYSHPSSVDADLAGAQYADGSSHRYLYNESAYVGGDLPHALTGIVDETGKRFATFHYDRAGRATTSEHYNGIDQVTVARGSDGVVTVTGPTKSAHRYHYTEVKGVNRLAGVDQPGGSGCGAAFSKLEYDGDGLVSRSFDFDGHVSEFTYDDDGRELTRAEGVGTPLARTTSKEWHARFMLPTKITLPGREERLAYDAAGNLIRRELWAAIDPTKKDAPLTLSRIWKFTYDAEGRLLQEEGPRSDAAGISLLQRYTYRASTAANCSGGTACDYRKGDLWTIENALGHKEEILRFDAAGRILAERNANGTLVENEYTERGWLLSRKETRTDGSVATTSLTYNERGGVTSITDADGVKLTFEYDAAGRLTMVANPSNHRLMFELDKAGNPIRETGYDSLFLKTQLKRTFDALGRMETEKGEDAGTSTFTYDEVGRPTGVTDGDGRRSSSSYDALGRLREAVGDLGGKQASIKATHDPLDQVTSVVDADAVTTSYLTTGMGDLASVDSPDGGEVFDEHDTAGLLSRHEGPGGIGSFRVSRDALGRPLTIAYGDAAADTHYAYDTPDATCPGDKRNAIGRLSSMEGVRGKTVFCYDAAGNVARRIQRWGTTTQTATYTYTKAGRLASMGVDGGATALYRYDIDGKVNGVKVDNAGASTDLITKVAYRPFDNIESWTYGNDYVFYNGRDKAGRITAWGGLDPNGSNYWVDPSPGGDIRADVTRGYAYAFNHNTLGYLDEVRDYNTGANLLSFEYNASGDRLSAKSGAANDRYVYQPGTHRLTMADGKARGYDDAGNLVALGDATLTYDSAARLASASEQGRLVVSYGYDGEGNRIARTVAATGKTTLTMFDEAGRWLADYDETGKVFKQAIWMNELLVGLVADGKLYYVGPDHLGSPREILDPARNVIVWRWWHNRDPFGSTLPDQDPDGDGVTFKFDLRFPGQRYDDLTGLHANGARDYDPTTGRYVQVDPLISAGSSPYVYAYSSPLSHSDPTGEIGIVGAALGAAIELATQAYGNYRRGCDVLGYRNYNWSHVGLSAVVGALAPGALNVARRSMTSAKAIQVLNRQLSTARTPARIAKLQGRINRHKDGIASVLVPQAGLTASKGAGKAVLDTEQDCGCSR